MNGSDQEAMEGPGSGAEEVPLSQQAEVAERFLTGVLDRFGLPATLDVREVDSETVELALRGEDLGLLIGPRGTTVEALQDLTRTVVQRRTGARRGRIMVDVAGYRQRRRQALERFVRSVAEQVRREGREQVLEAMAPPDRKVVHDTINTIPGVMTRSRGEEPQRRVVIVPAPDED
jgi:spoIIIJ-associated protein